MKRFCVDDETIMDYLEDRLQRRDREEVEKHLCHCADCRELLMLASELSHDTPCNHMDPVPSRVTQRTIESVETILKGQLNWGQRFLDGSRRLFSRGRSALDHWPLGLKPQSADLRSGHGITSDNLIRDHITGSGFQAVIEIEKFTETHCTVQVELTAETPLGPPLRVGLFANTHEVASATLLHKAVQFDDIPNGKYILKFSQANRQLDEYAFEV